MSIAGLSKKELNDVTSFIQSGDREGAIKTLYNKSPLTLKEARGVIDSLMEELSTAKNAQESDFLNIKIERVPNGINVTLKSAELEAFIREITSRPADVDTISKLMNSPNWNIDTKKPVFGYACPNHPIFTNTYSWGGTLMLGNNPNIAVICAKGLKDGVTIPFKGLYTEQQITEFISKLKSTVISVYREFMKPFAQELIIRYEEL